MTEPAAAASWDDLFADLGLPPDQPTEAASETPLTEAAPEPTHAEPERIEKAEAPARGRRRRSPSVAVEEPGAAEQAGLPEAPAVESTEAPIAPEDEAPEVGAAEPPASEGGEEAPAPRGRSRRRRRGRGSKSAAPGAAPAEAGSETPVDDAPEPGAEADESVPPTTEGEEEPGRRPRRRRSRGRNSEREEAPRAAVNVHEETPNDLEEEEAEPAGREDEIDDLSNWNVPSWAELIGSLYRPDR